MYKYGLFWMQHIRLIFVLTNHYCESIQFMSLSKIYDLNFYPLSKFGGLMCGLFRFNCGRVVDYIRTFMVKWWMDWFQYAGMDIVATLALGLRPRQVLARLWAKRKLGNVGECEGMNLHTPKRAPTLGVGVMVDSWIFRE